MGKLTRQRLARPMLFGRCMKNVTFFAGPKSGGFVNTRMSAMHHSSEARVGMAEAVVAFAVLAAVVGFALFIVS
jgi:hypothetical protein